MKKPRIVSALTSAGHVETFGAPRLANECRLHPLVVLGSTNLPSDNRWLRRFCTLNPLCLLGLHFEELTTTIFRRNHDVHEVVVVCILAHVINLIIIRDCLFQRSHLFTTWLRRYRISITTFLLLLYFKHIFGHVINFKIIKRIENLTHICGIRLVL